MGKKRFVEKERQVIAGIGSALVDILTHEDDDFLVRTGAAKGGMILVDKEHIERTLALASGTPHVVPGGSACNTIVGVGKLGGAARFVGKCGNGKMGQLFENDLRRNNVQPALLRSDSPTGRALSIITPDAQRSMFTFLGAAAETRPEEIASRWFEDAAIVHIEGYLLFKPDLIQAAAAAAKTAGARVSLDLASFTVVEEAGQLLTELVDAYVDILIANEDEARAFTGHADERQAVQALAEKAQIAVVKVGARGSYIAHGGETIAVEAMGDGAVVDTTGAGDLWAAGFLYGLVQGLPLEKCGQLGSACGWEVCRVVGANIPEQGWERIHELLAQMNQYKGA